MVSNVYAPYLQRFESEKKRAGSKPLSVWFVNFAVTCTEISDCRSDEETGQTARQISAVPWPFCPQSHCFRNGHCSYWCRIKSWVNLEDLQRLKGFFTHHTSSHAIETDCFLLDSFSQLDFNVWNGFTVIFISLLFLGCCLDFTEEYPLVFTPFGRSNERDKQHAQPFHRRTICDFG